MSVNTQTLSQIFSTLRSDQKSLHTQLTTYSSFMTQVRTSVLSVIEAFTLKCQHSKLEMQKTIDCLTKQIKEMSEDNSQLRNKYMAQVLQFQEISQTYQKVVKENQEKEAKVRELENQIAQIRGFLNELKDLKEEHEQGEIVDFDEEGDLVQRFEKLETINQESQHDMSVSMSLESLTSFRVQEGNSALKDKFNDIEDSSRGGIELTPKMNNYQVQDYQQALAILKNYTNSVSVMTKANKVQLSDAKENVPIQIDSNIPVSVQQVQGKPHKNCTMDKIKKMRRIDSLQLQTGYVVKSDKKPFSVHKPNSGHDSGQSSIRQSKIQLREESSCKTSYGLGSGNISGRSSVGSTRIRSQQILSLQESLKNLNQVIEQIKTIYQYPYKTFKLGKSILKIQCAGGWTYYGGCDEKDQPSGFGKLNLNGQSVFQGEWRNGKLHGWGKLVLLSFQKGQERQVIQVDGNFRNGQIDGTVVCVFNTGQKFMGIMKNGSFEHEGTFVSQKGILTGHWEDSCLVLLI